MSPRAPPRQSVAWFAVAILLVHTWLPLVLQALPDPSAAVGTGAHHAGSEAAGHGADQRHHPGPGDDLSIKCSLCIVAQTGHLLAPGAAITPPPVATADSRHAGLLHQRHLGHEPLRFARPRAPPSLAHLV
jgi:hypothetical protein